MVRVAIPTFRSRVSPVFDFHGAGYKPSPLGGNVFSESFPWLYIRSRMPSKSDREGEPWEKNVIGAVLIQ